MIEDKIKEINNLSFKSSVSKDEKEKEQLESELKQILDGLKKDAIDKFQNESDLKKFLDNIPKFYNYSFNNQLLIHLQNPDATFVAPLRKFSQMGYKVNKGSKSIKILIPLFNKIVQIKQNDNSVISKYEYQLTDEEKKIFKDKTNDQITLLKEKLSRFKVGFVFDAKQTDMPLDKVEEELYPTSNSLESKELLNVFVKTIYRDNYKVSFVDKIESGAKGYCKTDSNEIVVLDTLGSDMKLKVLIHEYAHALSHIHLINQNKDYKEHQNKYESEAESIAYVVSKYLGINTQDSSLGYLYAWSKEKDFKELEDSFSMIVNASKKIINNFEKMYDKNHGLYSEELKPSI
jgi:hypothetical protein